MNEPKNKPSKGVYYRLFFELFRAYTIPTIALSGAIADFWCKYPFIPTQAAKKTAEFGHADCTIINDNDLKKQKNLFPRFK